MNLGGDDKPYSMLMDKGIRDFMIMSDGFYPPNAVELSVEQQRALYNEMSAHFRKSRPDNIAVSDLSIADGNVDIPIRIYTQKSRSQLPVLLYLHGGGYVVGGLESHDDICAEIAYCADITVIAVDYRLAPEHPFPAAFNDCRAVLYALQNLAKKYDFDGERLIVGGDSAGGNLAAALCFEARDRNRPKIAGQVLIYPGLGGDMSKGSYISHDIWSAV